MSIPVLHCLDIPWFYWCHELDIDVLVLRNVWIKTSQAVLKIFFTIFLKELTLSFNEPLACAFFEHHSAFSEFVHRKKLETINTKFGQKNIYWI